MSPVAANLIAEMERTGMTTAYLARQLEVAERQITRWRRGQQPRYEFVVRLGEAFGREPGWFFHRHENDPDAIAV